MKLPFFQSPSNSPLAPEKATTAQSAYWVAPATGKSTNKKSLFLLPPYLKYQSHPQNASEQGWITLDKTKGVKECLGEAHVFFKKGGLGEESLFYKKAWFPQSGSKKTFTGILALYHTVFKVAFFVPPKLSFPY